MIRSHHVTVFICLWMLNSIINGQFSPKSQTITTTNTPINGIKTYIIDPVGTTISNNKWVIEDLINTRWSLRISLDSTWQFDSILPSAIQMDISGENDVFSNSNLDLLLSFEFYSQQKYFTLLLNLDNNNNNIISPACDNNKYNPSQPMLNGDAYTDMINSTNDKKCKVMSNDNNICIYEPLSTAPITNQWPFTFTIKNYPNSGNGYSIFQYISNDGTLQYCAFNQEILSNTELDIWITPEKINQQFTISQFNFKSFYIPTVTSNNPTILPSKTPTDVPTNIPSNIPTNMPTGSPMSFNPSQTVTNNPSNNPSIYPTKIPSNIPSIYPTRMPLNTASQNPTTAPTNIPSNNPSIYPTKIPSNIPSAYPSQNPSTVPTNIPSNNPSVNPTKMHLTSQQPSTTPTNVPSNNPSIYPTQSVISHEPSVHPTNLPSNNPTQMSVISQQPSVHPTDVPSNNPSQFISENPSDAPTKMPTNNPVQFISQNPTKIPTHNPIQLITQNPVTETPTLRPLTLVTDNPTTVITTTKYIETLTSLSATIYNTDDIAVAKLNSDTISEQETVIPKIVIVILLFAFIIAFLDIIHSGSKQECSFICGSHRSDEYNYQIIIIMALRICDIITDISVFVIICWYHKTTEKYAYGFLLLLIVCDAASLLTVYAMNVFGMCKVVRLPTYNEGPSIWFGKYMLFFVFLIFMSCDLYLTVKLISSNILGMSIFNSHHSSIELEKIKSIKLVTILFQNIPQIIMQSLFLIVVQEHKILIIMSIIISFILSVPLLISWYLSNKNNVFILQPYEIECTLSPPPYTKDTLSAIGTIVSGINITSDATYEMTQIMKYIRCKRILRKQLALILGINSSKLEINYICIHRENGSNGFMLRIYIVQQMLNGQDVSLLYDNKYNSIINEIKRIYHISLDWKMSCCLNMRRDFTDKRFNSNKTTITAFTEMSNYNSPNIFKVDDSEDDDDNLSAKFDIDTIKNQQIDNKIQNKIENDDDIIIPDAILSPPTYGKHLIDKDDEEKELMLVPADAMIMRTGFSNSTIDEELYGSHSNQSDKITKSGHISGKTTMGMYDDIHPNDIDDDNDTIGNDNDINENKLIIVPEIKLQKKHRKLYSEGGKKHRKLYSEGPKMLLKNRVENMNTNDKYGEYKNNMDKIDFKHDIPNNNPKLNIHVNSSSSFAMNNGKRRTVYSEGPKQGRNSNIGPSLSNSNSKISDIFGIGNNESSFKITNKMATIQDDSNSKVDD